MTLSFLTEEMLACRRACVLLPPMHVCLRLSTSMRVTAILPVCVSWATYVLLKRITLGYGTRRGTILVCSPVANFVSLSVFALAPLSSALLSLESVVVVLSIHVVSMRSAVRMGKVREGTTQLPQ